MSTTRLLILGLVRWLQPVHGYDVRRELLSWGADAWANVAPGSVYHALKKMTGEQLLRETGTEQVGGRPARISYEVTEAGEREFQRLLRRYWSVYSAPIDPFATAFVFLPALPRDEAVAALRHRARQLRAHADGLAPGADSGRIDGTKPPHVRQTFRLIEARCRVEADWCDETAGLVAAGELPAGRPTGVRPDRAVDPGDGATVPTSNNQP